MEKQNNFIIEIDVEAIKAFMALSCEEKLRRLEELNEFYRQAMPQKSKEAWEILKKQGF
jgi:hypothetical protein